MIFGSRRKTAEKAERGRPASPVELHSLAGEAATSSPSSESAATQSGARQSVPADSVSARSVAASSAPESSETDWKRGKFDGIPKTPATSADSSSSTSASATTDAEVERSPIPMPSATSTDVVDVTENAMRSEASADGAAVSDLQSRVTALQSSIDSLRSRGVQSTSTGMFFGSADGATVSSGTNIDDVSVAEPWSEIAQPRVASVGETVTESAPSANAASGVRPSDATREASSSAGSSSAGSPASGEAGLGELTPEDFVDVGRSTETLRFATETADAAIADAKAMANEILADAEQQRKEIIRRARHQAEHDFAAERDRVESLSASWKVQRIEILEQLEALSAVFGRYHDGVVKLDHALLTTAREMRGEVQPVAAAVDLRDGALDESSASEGASGDVGTVESGGEAASGPLFS